MCIRDRITTLRTGSTDDASEQVVEMLNSKVSPQSIYDALFLAGGELLMRQPGIVALHALTSTNAFHYAYRTATDDNTRRMALLQNAAFLTMFREAMNNRGDVATKNIVELAKTDGDTGVEHVFANVGKDNEAAAKHALACLNKPGTADELISEARKFVFLKGTDSHDYKFSSAVLEDYYNISPSWRDRYLAASVYKLRGANGKDNGLVERIKTALA